MQQEKETPSTNAHIIHTLYTHICLFICTPIRHEYTYVTYSSCTASWDNVFRHHKSKQKNSVNKKNNFRLKRRQFDWIKWALITSPQVNHFIKWITHLTRADFINSIPRVYQIPKVLSTILITRLLSSVIKTIKSVYKILNK